MPRCLDCGVELKDARSKRCRSHAVAFTKTGTKWGEGRKPVDFKGDKNPFWGKKHSKETKLKISESRNGKGTGEANSKWVGDKVGYYPLHAWVKRKLGKAKECVYCGSVSNVQWASISHRAKRDLEDYISLCGKCHHSYDDISIKSWDTRRSEYKQLCVQS